MRGKDLENGLREIVGERVTTNSFERWFYTSDLVSIPKVIKALFKTMPDAVVKANIVEEVCSILSYCTRNGIPVVPRGAGTSGLFGAVPKKGGVVLDLRNLSGVIEIDRNGETATTEAGITWWELDRRLGIEGLTLRSYPSSARSATVAGWIMGNGLGIGTLKYGPVSEQLLSAEVVLADGTLSPYIRGQGLEWFMESEGVLGIITKVCLRVRLLPQSTSHQLIYFEDMKDLFGFVNPLANTSPCPYAVEIFDHKYLGLIKESGYQVTDFGPRGGTVLVTYEGEKEEVEEGKRAVERLELQFHGEEREGAEEEWQQRFNMLRVRRAAPTVIPSSVHVPLGNLNQFYLGLDKLKKRPIGLLGHVTSNSDCMAMPMVVTNEKKLVEYILALHTPREISNLALSLGGKPGGGLGVWNAPYKKQILSKTKFAEIKKRKKELDSKGILNPGMWLNSPLFLNPVIYQTAMAAASIIDRIIPGKVSKREIPAFLEEISACSQCGYCMNYCPTKQEWISSTPRGRILMTKELLGEQSLHHQKVTTEYLNAIFQCTLCGRCKVNCSVDIKSPQMWGDLRADLVKNGFELECLKALTTNIDQTHNIATKDNDQRARWTSRLKLLYELDKKEKAKVIYYVGCITSFYPMVHDIARSFAQILDAAGIDFAILGGEEWCCGYPLMVAGHKEEAARTMKHNIDKMRERGAESVVMTCPGCLRMWKDGYREITGQEIPFDVFHATEFIVKLIEQGEIEFGELNESITYHDPCDLGRNSAVFDEPRYILRKISSLNFIELKDSREYCSCCGSGGDLLVLNQDLSLDIARRKVNEALDTGVGTLVTACPSCIRAITMAKASEKAQLEILDITQLVWKAMVKRREERRDISKT
ncbi:Lactate utilization protein A [subsurface metagenome]|jgi:Fe-S oxidoreductase/FAD/FMN-containing dehydrogenase